MSARQADGPPGPLTGVVVVDAGDSVASLYAGQLVADLGATVLRIDDAAFGADLSALPSRMRAREALLRNRILVAAGSAPDRESVLRAALRASDALIVGTGAAATGMLGLAESRREQPAIIRCQISPFGADSPWADRAGDDLIVQALAGAMEITGEPGRPPVRMGAPVLALMAGAQAAVAILACLQEQAERPGSRSIDISLLDVSLSVLSYLAPMYLTLGQLPARVGSGHPTIYPYNAFEVADGYLVVAPFTGRFWRNFCQVLDAPELAEDQRFRGFQNRLDNRHILEPILTERMKGRTRDQWQALLEAGDVPCGPANDVAEALAMEQTRFRGMVVDVVDEVGATTASTALPVKFTGADGQHFDPAYRAARRGEVPAAPRRPRSGTEPGAGPAVPPRPLSGIRVVDLTRMAAGPFGAEMLSDLGADVVKVEEPQIGDPTRRNVPAIEELSSYFLAFNRGKRSVSLDMKTSEGRDAVLGLLAGADVVVENFRPGVMDRLGLSYDEVRAINDRIIYASISGFGQTGPLRLKTSFDLVNQAMAGMLSITGEPGRAPVRLGLPVGDLAGGQFTALGIVAGLVQRRRTGRGTSVDVSLHDVLIALLGDVAQTYLSTGVVPGRLGAQYSDRVPAAVHAAADGFVAIEAWSDDAWRALADRLDAPALGDPRFADAAGRLEYRDEIYGILAAIVSGRPAGAWVDAFRGTSVGLAPVLDVGRALDSVHARARGLVLEVPLPAGGRARTIGSAFRIDGHPVASAGGPPSLGQHTREVLEAVPDPQAIGMEAVT
jgi:crotonobetainyl-CoA:carnitine CoA-transferase CaiB-like acyl-CoA transferase